MHPNYKAVDWVKYSAELGNKLHQAGILADTHISSLALLDNYIESLTCTIQDTTATHAPAARPSPSSKCWWTPELSNLRCKYAKLSRIEFASRSSLTFAETRAQCSVAHNCYNSTLRCTKVAHWKNWLKDITEDNIWKAGWMAQSQISDGSTTCIPTLFDKALDSSILHEYTTAAEKQEVFK